MSTLNTFPAVPTTDEYQAVRARLQDAHDALEYGEHGLDLDAATVRVRASLDRVRDESGAYRRQPPKSKASRRDVPLPADAVKALREHRLATGRPEDGSPVLPAGRRAVDADSPLPGVPAGDKGGGHRGAAPEPARREARLRDLAARRPRFGSRSREAARPRAQAVRPRAPRRGSGRWRHVGRLARGAESVTESSRGSHRRRGYTVTVR